MQKSAPPPPIKLIETGAHPFVSLSLRWMRWRVPYLKFDESDKERGKGGAVKSWSLWHIGRDVSNLWVCHDVTSEGRILKLVTRGGYFDWLGLSKCSWQNRPVRYSATPRHTVRIFLKTPERIGRRLWMDEKKKLRQTPVIIDIR
jgi:hypothetical protein